MTTLNILKRALREKIASVPSSATQQLSELQYSYGFDILKHGSKQTIEDFIIPRLSEVLGPLFNSRVSILVLEVGPGPESVLGCLPECMKRKITKDTALEPNHFLASKLREWFAPTLEKDGPMPYLNSLPVIHQLPFGLDSTNDSTETFHVVLFCHSMYGMRPRGRYIERALEMLVRRPEGAMVVVLHRDGSLNLEGLMCHRMASFPTGVVRIQDDDPVLDGFASFITGFSVQDVQTNKSVQIEWRKVSRALGRREEAHPNQLLFSSPNIMAALTKHAIAWPELAEQVLTVREGDRVKSRQARLHHPAVVLRSREIKHVQRAVRWALEHGASLAVIGGGHSGQCMWPHRLAIDMAAFDQVHILPGREEKGASKTGFDPGLGALVVVEAGCKSGDIIRKNMAMGLTLPLGARPSVGAGLWLQGGIGHLARQHGLACDAIVGAIVVSVASGQILCVGHVPSQLQPTGAVQPESGTRLATGFERCRDKLRHRNRRYF